MKLSELKMELGKDYLDLEAFTREVDAYLKSILFRYANLDSYYSRYAAYVYVMGIRMDSSSETVMCVVLESDSISLVVNPIMLIDYVKSDAQVMFLFTHEVSHIINGHLTKYYDLFVDEVLRVVVNLATDVEINESICHNVPSADFPAGGCNRHTYFRIMGTSDNTFPIADMSIKKLIDKICSLYGMSIKNILYMVTIHRTTFSNEVIRVACTGNSPCFNIRDKDRDEAIRFSKELANYIKAAVTGIVVIDPDVVTSAEEVGAIVEGISENADMISDGFSPKSRSDFGSGRTSVKNVKAAKPVVTWQTILKRYLSAKSFEYRYSHRRINRRQPDRLELSGRMHEYIANVVIAVDESGSISNAEYRYFLSEIESMVGCYKCNLYFMEFTDHVMNTEFVPANRTKRFIKGKIASESRYTGGTVYYPIFSEVESLNIGDDFLLVILTDGYGEKEVDFRGVENRLWVITGNGDLSCKEEPRNIINIV